MKADLRMRWLCAAALLLPAFAAGDEPRGLGIDPSLSLRAVVDRAFERNPQQHVLQADAVGAAARADYARSVLPAAPAVSINNQSDAIASGRNLREWDVALELPIWMPGQRAARDALAREARDGLDAGRESLKLELAGQVREALWDIAINADGAELAAQRVHGVELLQRDVEQRWKAGDLARADVMLAQNETLQARSALLRAGAELQHAQYRYRVLTGLAQLPASAREALSPRSAITDDHPLLAEASARVLLARQERELARLEKRENPQLMLNARRTRGAFDAEFDNSVGFAIRVPLESAVRASPMLAQAEMGLAQALSARERLLLRLRTSLHEAAHDLEVTRSELGIVAQQHRLAQESLRLAKKAFDLGESDLVALLRVQAMAREAERALRSRETQLQRDIARYNQAVGVLP